MKYPRYVRLKDSCFRLVEIQKDYARYFIDNGTWDFKAKYKFTPFLRRHLHIFDTYYEINQLNGMRVVECSEKEYKESSGQYFKPAINSVAPKEINKDI